MTAEVVINVRAEDNFSGVLGNFGSIITGIESAINLIGQAFSFVVGAITPFINSAAEGEEAVARLEGVLRATGFAANMTSEELQALASTIQQTTRYSDEQVMSSEALMLTFRNIGEDVFPRAIMAAVDMAEIFGSLESSTMQLGKALQDPVSMLGALSRAGVTFTDEQKEMIRNFVETGDVAAAQNIILTEVENQVGGLAVTMGQTFGGQVDILRNRFDEIAETIGTSLLPILGQGIDLIENWTPAIESLGNSLAQYLLPVLETLGVRMTEFFESFDWGEILNGLTGFRDTVLEILDRFAPGAEGFLDFFAGFMEDIQPVIDVALPVIVTLLERLGEVSLDFLVDSFNGLGEWFADNEELIARVAGMVIQISVGFLGLATIIAEYLLPQIGRLAEIFFDLVRFGMELVTGDFSRLGAIFIDLGDAVARDFLNAVTVAFANNMFVQLFAGLITQVKNLFGIASPSSVFADIGRDIVLGLIAGFGGMWSRFVNYVSGLFTDLLETFGIDNIFSALTGGTQSGGVQGTFPSGFGSGTGGTGGTSTGSGTVVNQYFAGATINVGSWDQIAYDCLYPNPFIAATSGGISGGVVQR